MNDLHLNDKKPRISAEESRAGQGRTVSGEASSEQFKAVLRPNFLWRFLRIPFYVFCRCWIRVHAEGVERIDDTRGGLFLMNHQSFLDPLMAAVLLTRPVSYLARDSLFRVPVIGCILRRTYVIPISREAARGGSIRMAIERLEEGFLVGVFPEGTRSSDGSLGPFRPGFLALARRTDQPIYPVGIAGAGDVMPRGAWWIRPGRIQVVYGDPLSCDEVSSLRNDQSPERTCIVIRDRVADCVRRASELLSGKAS